MSDVTPSAEVCEVDPDLMRRVAWGMIAGKSKADIAAAEDLTPEECQIVCTAPGMFSIMNVWMNFLEPRKEGGRKYTRKLTGWCVDHVFEHAPERLNRNEVWRLDRLSSVMLHYGFAIVFVWMLGFLDGVMGVPGAKRRDLGDFKQNLVDLLCWAIEVTFREKMLEQYSVDLLIAKDGAFQAAIAGREYYELGIGSELQVAEAAAEHPESPRAISSTIATEAAPPVASGSAERPPVRTKSRPDSPRLSRSSPATKTAIRKRALSARKSWPLRGGTGPGWAAARPPSATPMPTRPTIRPPPREAITRDRRWKQPPLRSGPMLA